MTTTANPGTAGRREATMATTPSFHVTCPCGCGEVVGAFDAGFSATTVTVAACSNRQAAGVVSTETRKSWAYGAAVSTETVWQHRDGLVSFSGAI